MIRVAAAFLLLSGIASLTYQVVWVRLLGLSMGSTSASISTVLAAFFLGLALGSYLAERITRNNIDSLKVYIVLEAIIGISGLALLPLLLNLDSVLVFLQAGSSIPSKFVITMVLLSIPTICMGATFPVMASLLIRKKDEVGLRVSQLYSLNTAGAVLGACLAGFVFVPQWGLDGAIYIAFSINAFIVAIAIYLDKRLVLPPLEIAVESASDAGKAPSHEEAPFRGRALIILFTTGLVAIATEVGWTKYLSIFTGTTIYGFAAILTVFLIGIASGSWAIKSHLEKIRRPDLWMAFGLILLGGFLLLTRSGLGIIPPIYEAVNHLPESGGVKNATKYFFVFLLLFPPTFVFGALFPLNLKLYCGNLQGVRSRIGKAYAVNTVASIFGSVIAGFWIIPQYGTDALLSIMAMLILLLPFLFVPSFAKAAPRYAIPAVASLVIVANWILPHISYERLIESVQYKYDSDAMSGKKPEILYLKEGKAGVISMVSYNGRYVKLQNNGLNESLIDLEDENNALLVETLLGLVPYILAEDPKSAFVVGFGGGITSRAMTLTNLERIKVVELEPAVVDAGRAIYKGELPALKDPRVSIEFNDARNTLLLDKSKYDLVVAQPSHPWLARASTVFTKEFFMLVHDRLNPGGVYGQWVNLFNMDSTTLKSLFNAFYGVFPSGLVIANINTGDLIMLGSDHELQFEYERMAKRMAEPKVKQALNYRSIYEPEDLFWYFCLSRQQALDAAKGVVANSDMNIFSEVRLSALHGEPEGDENPYTFLKDVYSLQVAEYMKGDVNSMLFSLAQKAFHWNEAGMAEHIAKQLESRDPVLAAAVRYKQVWRDGNIGKAEKQFAEQSRWPDSSIVMHANLLSDHGKQAQYQEQIEKLSDESLKRAMKAKLLYAQQNWKQLKQLNPKFPEEKKWQLTAMGRENIRLAGERLMKLESEVEMEIPQYRLLMQYAAVMNDHSRVTLYSRRMLKKVDEKVERLSRFANVALNDKRLEEAEQFLGKMAGLNPEATQVADLKKRIEQRKSSQRVQAKKAL